MYNPTYIASGRVISSYWYKSLIMLQEVNPCEVVHQHVKLHRILHAAKKPYFGLFWFFNQEGAYMAALQQQHSWGHQTGSKAALVRLVPYSHGIPQRGFRLQPLSAEAASQRCCCIKAASTWFMALAAFTLMQPLHWDEYWAFWLRIEF